MYKRKHSIVFKFLLIYFLNKGGINCLIYSSILKCVTCYSIMLLLILFETIKFLNNNYKTDSVIVH